MDDETADERLERLRTRLTEQQRRFCEVYLSTLDPEEAYQAGYGSPSKQKGIRLLGLWYVQDYLGALTEASTVDDTVITRTELLAHLADILRSGEDKDRIASARVISHVRGFGVKKVEHSGSIKSGLSDEDILQIRRKFLGIDKV